MGVIIASIHYFVTLRLDSRYFLIQGTFPSWPSSVKSSKMDSTDPSKLFSVKGMVVCITGGGTGIGLMMTKAFANNGAAKVYIVGRRREKLQEAAKVSSHGNIIPVVGDVTSKESLCEVAEQIKKEVGYVNLLIWWVCLESHSDTSH